MAMCQYCGTEANLYCKGVPICLACDDKQGQKLFLTNSLIRLVHDVLMQPQKPST